MKRLLFFFSTAIIAIVLFVTCQKTISFQQSSDASALGTLKDSSGNCMIDSLVGTFYNGVPPGSDTCYVKLEVNIINTGSYAIYTDSSNGFGFADSGYFYETGIHTIKLKPVGTPHWIDTTNFTLHFNDDSCFFSVPVKDSTGLRYYDLSRDAEGTMESFGQCFPIEVHGQYYNYIPLGDTNFIKASVIITYPGNFKISTDTVNGFYFSAEQKLTEPGLYTFSLIGHGTPANIETSNFHVKFDGEACPFNIEVKDSIERIVLKTAAYEATENMCQNAVVKGDYKIWQALDQENTITLSINVTNLGNGSYTIGTNQTNETNCSFWSSGTFSSTGVQNVTLQGYGVPIRTGIINVPIKINPDSGNTSCSVPIYVKDREENFYDTSLNTWSFFEGGEAHHGYITQITQSTFGSDPAKLSFKGLDFYGEPDSLIDLTIEFPPGATYPIPGTYKTDPHTENSTAFHVNDAASGATIYTTQNSSADQNIGLTITITSYDPTRYRASGTFSGQVFDAVGNVVNITSGKFNVFVPL